MGNKETRAPIEDGLAGLGLEHQKRPTEWPDTEAGSAIQRSLAESDRWSHVLLARFESGRGAVQLTRYLKSIACFCNLERVAYCHTPIGVGR